MEDVPRFEYSSLFDPATAGLLVVDVQEKLWPFIAENDAVLRRISQMVRICGRLGLPILVTEQYVRGLGESIPLVKEGLGRFDAFDPIEKLAFSCFGEPKFVEALERSGIQTLALVGIEAHVCVMQTALDAIDRGIDVFFVAEATGSRDPRHKAEAIVRVRDAGAIVGSVEMFAFEALRGSDHPKFKEVQKVIV
jgi:nicotinamidase-related amidase